MALRAVKESVLGRLALPPLQPHARPRRAWPISAAPRAPWARL
jgi:hypothetical protein